MRRIMAHIAGQMYFSVKYYARERDPETLRFYIFPLKNARKFF